MAEIHIEKKRTMSPLLWLLLLIVLGVAGWFLYTNYAGESSPAPARQAAPTTTSRVPLHLLQAAA